MWGCEDASTTIAHYLHCLPLRLDRQHLGDSTQPAASNRYQKREGEERQQKNELCPERAQLENRHIHVRGVIVAIRVCIMNVLRMQLHSVCVRIGVQMQPCRLQNEQGEQRKQQNRSGNSVHSPTIAGLTGLSLREGRSALAAANQ